VHIEQQRRLEHMATKARDVFAPVERNEFGYGAS
jgi:hypothetical protein